MARCPVQQGHGAAAGAGSHDHHGIPFEYGDEVVDLVVSRCTEAESGGRVVDAILTNTVLPRISREYLQRLTAGQALKAVRLGVAEGDFTYAFD